MFFFVAFLVVGRQRLFSGRGGGSGGRGLGPRHSSTEDTLTTNNLTNREWTDMSIHGEVSDQRAGQPERTRRGLRFQSETTLVSVRAQATSRSVHSSSADAQKVTHKI